MHGCYYIALINMRAFNNWNMATTDVDILKLSLPVSYFSNCA